MRRCTRPHHPKDDHECLINMSIIKLVVVSVQITYTKSEEVDDDDKTFCQWESVDCNYVGWVSASLCDMSSRSHKD